MSLDFFQFTKSMLVSIASVRRILTVLIKFILCLGKCSIKSQLSADITQSVVLQGGSCFDTWSWDLILSWKWSQNQFFNFIYLFSFYTFRISVYAFMFDIKTFYSKVNLKPSSQVVFLQKKDYLLLREREGQEFLEAQQLFFLNLATLPVLFQPITDERLKS